MDPELEAFLDGRSPLASEAAKWGGIDLELRYYIVDQVPPDHLVTSVRAVVLTPTHALVVREPTGDEHIIPGGRRVAGESPEETVHREVLEETRWTIDVLSLLSVVHFHITSAVPEGYPYPNPDFLQVVYLARPHELRSDRVIEDDWVDRCELLPIDSLGEHRIPDAQRTLLAHAVRRARGRGAHRL